MTLTVYATPFQATVTDAEGNLVPNVTVLFSVSAAKYGTFAGSGGSV